jgi:Activator of Hsp90 ATPase homolog 1-like protein
MPAAGRELPPIRRSIHVPWEPDQAFRRFTAEFGSWWPLRNLSVGQAEAETCVFECRLGGRIYERVAGGVEHPWGEVTLWEPPRRVRFLWHPGRARERHQDVELSFTPDPHGTLVELVASGWERWGKGARGARRGYGLGWGYVLDVWSGRRTLRVRIIDALEALARRLRRRDQRPGAK